ncbi:paraneoplastic antigen Ma3-like [Hipposideros larvatus]
MSLTLFQDWCRGEHLNTQRSMLILGIPEDCGEDEFEESLQEALRHLGTYKIIGRMFRREENAQAFLLELAQDMDYGLIPREIPGKGGPWKVVVKPRNSDGEFLNRLNRFLEEERRTVSDMNRVLQSDTNCPFPRLAISPEFWTWAQTLGAAVQPLLEQMLYRELRVFSGNTVSTPGDFEAWLGHTTEMLQMWQVPEGEKRRRLMECLRGPALQVVSGLRAHNAAITVEECLAALQQVFGPVESHKIARVKFCKAYQEAGEKVSSFVLRLEPLLQRAVEKNVVSRRNVNQARLKQVLGGATLTDKLRKKLKLMKQRRKAPGFLALVKLLREEEEWEATLGPKRQRLDQLEAGMRSDARASGFRPVSFPAPSNTLQARPPQSSLRKRGRGQYHREGVSRAGSGCNGQEPSEAQGQVGSGKQSSSYYYRQRRQKRCWKKGKGQSAQTAEDLSRAEGQGSQAQAKPPCPPPAERDSTREAEDGSLWSKHTVLNRYQQHKQEATTPGTWGAPATGGDSTTAEAEGGATGGSGLGPFIRPPPNAHPVCSELRMPTGCQATRGLEEASPAPTLPEGASTGEEELLHREGHWKPGESTQRTGTGLENHDSAAAKANSSPKPSQLG